MNGRRTSNDTRRGAMLVLIAICLPLCIIMAAFAIDVAWMQLVRTELRTATDAAARAGAKELSLSQNETAARKRAKQAARRNRVAGDPLRLANRDIEIGKSTQATPTSRFKFTPGGAKPNAVRVTGKRTESSKSGPVNLLFAGVLGVDQFKPQETATSTQLDRDICLVVDRSGSMMESLDGGRNPQGKCDKPHPTKSRWGALSIAVKAFLDELAKTVQDEHVALASYSSNTTECGNRYRIATIDSDLVSDYTKIDDEIDRIGSKPVKGRTSISAGLDKAIEVLTGKKTRPFAVKTIVLMTDGIHNLGKEPLESAKDAKKKDIVIHTITFSDDADIKRMKEVAAETGGKHFHAPDGASLVKIFKEIAATLPVLTTE
jgi:Ca-activated chloride channel family protein